MQSISAFLRAHRHAAGTSLIAAALLLAGCGSSSSHSTSSAAAPICPKGEKTCVSTSTKTLGRKDANTRLTLEIKRSLPTLKQVKVSCPAHPKKYPFTCRFTGINTVKGKPVPVRGTAKILAFDTKTDTYGIEGVFGPIKR